MELCDGSPWTTPETVAGFVEAEPNGVLMRFAETELRRRGTGRALDIGCGAGRNALPLARHGWRVDGTDLSWPMLRAAARRARSEGLAERVRLTLAPMDRLPIASASADLVVAHGIWNLARSSAEMRAAMAEAARVAKPGAALFVFTFSRNTLAPDAAPVAGETFVFTQFSGAPQCFLTEAELVEELDARGFVPDPAVALTEYNRPGPDSLTRGRVPVIYEAAFRRR